MSTPVAGSLATVPLHVAAGDVAVWWNDAGATWESIPLGSGAAGATGATGPAGPPGPTGAAGATGATGAANMTGMVAGQLPIAASATSVAASVAVLAASFMPAHTGDVTSPAGGTVNTLATVNANVGTWNNVTVNAKGLATAGSNVAYVTGGPYLPTAGGTLTGALQVSPNIVVGNAVTNPPTTGLVVNANAAATIAAPAATTLRLIALDATANFLLMDAFGQQNQITGRRAGGTGASLAAVPANSVLLTLIGGGHDGTAFVNSAAQIALFSDTGTTWSTANHGAHIRIYTTPSGSTTTAEVMRIDQNGNVGIGTVGPLVKLHVAGAAAVGTTASAVSSGPNGADSTTVLKQFYDFGNTIGLGAISRTGTNSVAYNTTSDARLKDEIGESSRGLDALMAIKVSDYRMGETAQQGLLAQNVAKVYPEAVHEGGDDPALQPWMLDYGRLTPLLIRTIQQQQGQLGEAMARIAALEAGG